MHTFKHNVKLNDNNKKVKKYLHNVGGHLKINDGVSIMLPMCINYLDIILQRNYSYNILLFDIIVVRRSECIILLLLVLRDMFVTVEIIKLH